MNFPFLQKQLSSKELQRVFEETVDEGDLQWHYDEQDRLVEPLEETDWLIQFDNELPKPIKESFIIPKNVYHRVIKGSKDLKVKITLLN